MSTGDPFGPGPGSDAARWNPIDTGEWYEARNATAALRDVLIAAGLDREFPYLRAELNAFGHGIVELGRTSPQAAQRLAELLDLGQAMTQMAEGPDRRRSDDGRQR